jgi:hypothetical protein
VCLLCGTFCDESFGAAQCQPSQLASVDKKAMISNRNHRLVKAMRQKKIKHYFR